MTHHHGYRQTVGRRLPNRNDGEGVINLISIFIHLFVICYSMEHVMFIIIVEERWGGCYQFDTNLHPSFWDMLQFETCNVTVYMRDWGWRYQFYTNLYPSFWVMFSMKSVMASVFRRDGEGISILY